MNEYRQNKGYTYEEYVLNYLYNEYDSVYLFKDTPEDIIAKTKLYSNYDIYLKYKNCDIGADIVALKDNTVYFIQCKNFDNTISINDFCSFYFLILEYELNGIVYYNGVLSERLKDLSQNKVKYYNLPYNNTLIDINFINNEEKDIIPRDYQLEIYNNFKTINRGIIALPCGMGKTYCSWLIGKDYDNIIIISPTRNLSDNNLIQLYNYSKNTYNPILISMDGNRDYKNIKQLLKNKNILSSTYDSVDILNKVIKKLDNYIIFIDEFHNLSTNNLENENDVINKLLNRNNKIIFMSATPFLDSKYNNIFGNYIYNYDWKKAIENNYICNFRLILPEETDNTEIFDEFLKNINYNDNNKELIIKCFFIMKGIIFYGNKKTILYASNVEEANEYSKIIEWLKKLLNIEINTNIISYTTSKLNRIEYIKNFKTNNINQILINVQILNEGIDIPVCDSIFITKPNENIINLIQRMCRCNRLLPNKKTGYVYLWCDKYNKIFKFLNKFINETYIIEYYKNTRQNKTLSNNKQNKIINNNKQDLTISNKQNKIDTNNNLIIVNSKYMCKICNKKYSSYKSMWNHNKTYHNNTESTINVSNVKKEDNVKKENTCRYCSKELSRQDGVKRHEKTCKEKNLLENKELKKELSEIKKQIDILLESKKNITINNNSSNNTINIIKFGSENINELLTTNEIFKILTNNYSSINESIKAVHFNDNRPEYHNIYITNLRDDIAYFYNGYKFIALNKLSLLNKLINNHMKHIKIMLRDYRDKLPQRTVDILDILITRMNDDNTTFIDEANNKKYKNYKAYKINEIKLMIYNESGKKNNKIINLNCSKQLVKNE